MKRLITAAAMAILGLAATNGAAQACNPLLNKDFGKHIAPSHMPIAMLRPGIR